jgi:hypothetical protein
VNFSHIPKFKILGCDSEPQQNRVVERRNHALIVMVTSMLSYSTLPINLCMEALKPVIHILNRVPSKSVSKNVV